MRKKFLLLILVCFNFPAMSQPSEKLSYVLHYGLMKGGEAYLTVSDTTFQNKNALHFYMRGYTTGITNSLFGVDDIYESFSDPQTILPYMTIRNIREQKHRYYNETFFFNDKDSLFSKRSGGSKAPHNTVDILTAFFYLRHNNLLDKLDHGELFTLSVFHADKCLLMSVKYLGTEKIKTKFGKKECYVLSPYVDKGKLFKRSDGLKFYITKDKNRIPVLLEFDMFIGSLKAELVSYEKNGEKHKR